MCVHVGVRVYILKHVVGSKYSSRFEQLKRENMDLSISGYDEIHRVYAHTVIV